MSKFFFAALKHMLRAAHPVLRRRVYDASILVAFLVLCAPNFAFAERILVTLEPGSSKMHVMRESDVSRETGQPLKPDGLFFSKDLFAFLNLPVQNIAAAVVYDSTTCMALNEGQFRLIGNQPRFGTLATSTVTLTLPFDIDCGGTPLPFQSVNYTWTHNNSNPSTCGLVDNFTVVFAFGIVTAPPGTPIIIPFPIAFIPLDITFAIEMDYAPRIMFAASSTHGQQIDITCANNGSSEMMSARPATTIVPHAALSIIPNPPTAAVGEQVRLTLVPLPLPPGTWSFLSSPGISGLMAPQPVAGYAPDADFACVPDVRILPPQTDAKTLNCPTSLVTDNTGISPNSMLRFYFVGAGPDSRLPYTVHYSAGLVDTVAVINVVGPTNYAINTPFCQNTPTVFHDDTRGCQLGFGFVFDIDGSSCQPTNGSTTESTESSAVFQTKLEGPQNFLGKYRWVQVINKYSTNRLSPNEIGTRDCPRDGGLVPNTDGLILPDLDTQIPAVDSNAPNENIQFTDGPNIRLSEDSIIQQLDFSFRLYLQWEPTENRLVGISLFSPIYVTLGYVDWKVFGQTQHDETSPSGWKTSGIAGAEDFIGDATYPQWFGTQTACAERVVPIQDGPESRPEITVLGR